MNERRLQSPHGIIPITADEVEDLFSGDRDYFLVAFLTSAGNEKCRLCGIAQPIVETVAKSFHESNPHLNRVFFVSLDAKDNLQHFQNYQINTVPHLWIFPIPSEIYKPQDSEDPFDHRIPRPEKLSLISEHYTYPFSDSISVADQELRFAKSLGELTQTRIIINKPLDVKLALQYCAGFFLVFRILRARKEKVMEKLRNGTGVMVLSIVTIFLCLSGVNFAIQRNVPFLVKGANQTIKYIAPGVQNEIGSEVVISIAFQALFAALLWALIQGVTTVPKENKATSMLIYGALLFIVYNLFTSMYKAKDPGYPFTYLYIPIF
ncbi:hypothetical protein OGAPHI_001971 [Ogataea philodendri]|uniref:Uncharacterized protein n=1 Tax=Ogataea philodendri TaxID=1378263 RepID=A0A9P8PBC4_9ASCO|nr:uncharacterized protein OGAPHI_001971 [Ogataea philodendri]KAH3668217.1 hypothetical protein OGAPHI_001971 [Ogataea philodendri]